MNNRYTRSVSVPFSNTKLEVQLNCPTGKTDGKQNKTKQKTAMSIEMYVKGKQN